MTYEEAELKLIKTGETTIRNGVLYINRITPSKQKDYINFAIELKCKPVSNEEMKKLSSDNSFTVRDYRKDYFPNA